MKKYVSCFLFFFCLTSACLVGLFYVTGREEESREAMEVQMTESVDRPVFAGSEAESRPAEYNLVLNQGRWILYIRRVRRKRRPKITASWRRRAI